MKTLLILSVLLSGVLAATAAAVGAAEAAPKEQPKNIQVPVVKEEVLAGEGPEVISPEEEVSSPEGRFFFCPSGWHKFKDSCFLYVRSGYTWNSAAAHCLNNGGSLASAHDVFDYAFLQELTMREGGSTAWIGGFYFQTWRWVDQSPFSYSNWLSVQSSTANPCVYLNARAGWSNASCGGGRPFICTRKISPC